MLAKKYLSRIVSIENKIEGGYTLAFESVSGKRFKFLPGQYLHLALDADYDGSGQWPESRCFSIQTNPADTNLKITYSVKGEFTRQMETELEEGSEVWLKLPYGDLFTQPHEKKNVVFIAGGTGITPFLSLFTSDLFHEYTNTKMYLGFKSPEYNIYKDALKPLEKSVEKSINYYFESENGVLDIHNIFKQVGDDFTYFISGPPQMIASFKEKLVAFGVEKEKILTDEWE